MQKRDPFLLGADAGGFVDEPDAGCTTTLEGGIEVVNGKAEVVDSRPALGHETSNGRVRGLGFEQLDERISGFEASDRRAVGVVERHLRHAEDIAIERQNLIEGTDRNTDVRESSSATG